MFVHLSEEIKRFVRERQLGYVASVCAMAALRIGGHLETTEVLEFALSARLF